MEIRVDVGRAIAVLGGQRHHRAGDLGIPLRAASLIEDRDCFAVGEGAPVRAIADHRVERIGDRDNTRLERDVLTAQPMRIAAAIETLVVGDDDRGILGQGRNSGQDLGARLGVALHDFPLRCGQRALFEEDRVRDADLADIVQNAGADRTFRHCRRQSEALRDPASPLAGRLGMTTGGIVASAEHREQTLNGRLAWGIAGNGRLIAGDGVSPGLDDLEKDDDRCEVAIECMGDLFGDRAGRVDHRDDRGGGVRVAHHARPVNDRIRGTIQQRLGERMHQRADDQRRDGEVVVLPQARDDAIGDLDALFVKSLSD